MSVLQEKEPPFVQLNGETDQNIRKRMRFDQFLKEMGWSRTTGYRKIKDGTIPKPHKIGAFNFLFVDETAACLNAAAQKHAA